MSWSKIKFLYDTMLDDSGGVVYASTTDTSGDYDPNYIYNMLEVNRWKAGDSRDPCYIVFDAGSGNAKSADSIAMLGHNLNSIGATISLQYTSATALADGTYLADGSILGDGAGSYTDAFTPFQPSSDRAFFKEFTDPGQFRYWRVKITGHTGVPEIAVCIWGKKTELDYATAGFDPHSQKAKADVNITQGGFVAGIHTKYIEREMTLKFHDADSSLYNRIKTWWENNGLKQFFVIWEDTGHPDDVFLMRPDGSFNNPLIQGGLYRDITIKLTGRRE